MQKELISHITKKGTKEHLINICKLGDKYTFVPNQPFNFPIEVQDTFCLILISALDYMKTGLKLELNKYELTEAEKLDPDIFRFLIQSGIDEREIQKNVLPFNMTVEKRDPITLAQQTISEVLREKNL